MATNDKEKDIRLSLRFTSAEYEWIEETANYMGLRLLNYARMCIVKTTADLRKETPDSPVEKVFSDGRMVSAKTEHPEMELTKHREFLSMERLSQEVQEIADRDEITIDEVLRRIKEQADSIS